MFLGYINLVLGIDWWLIDYARKRGVVYVCSKNAKTNLIITQKQQYNTIDHQTIPIETD